MYDELTLFVRQANHLCNKWSGMGAVYNVSAMSRYNKMNNRSGELKRELFSIEHRMVRDLQEKTLKRFLDREWGAVYNVSCPICISHDR